MLPSHVAVGSASALGMVLSNFIPLPVSVITLALNVFLLIMGFILIGPEFGAKTVVLSVLGTYFGGIIVDHFIFGLNIKRRVCVISPKLDEITDFVLHHLHSGATLNEITGAYDKTPKKEIITIVDKNEYRKLMDFIKKIDPKAFVTVYSVNEIQYQPKV